MKPPKLEKKYDSKWGAKGKITAAQILAEVMCERVARQRNVQLTERFWLKDEWKKTFAQQTRFATSLLQLYEPAVISHVLRVGKGRQAYSLGAPFLDELFSQEQAIRRQKQAITEVKAAERAEEAKAEPTTTEPLPASRPDFVDKSKPNVLSKLKGL
jgi:hypothetical protein